MNSGAANAGYGHKRRTGFTLVEVIIVLVILAILAAIAIPALTGYIDKAKVVELKASVKHLQTASQTLIAEEMAANGGTIKTGPTSNFAQINPADVTAPDPANQLYEFQIRASEYEKLTGVSLFDIIDWDTGAYTRTDSVSWNVTTDRSGAVRIVYLEYKNYFGGSTTATSTRLVIVWFDNYSASDPLGLYIAAKNENGTTTNVINKVMFNNVTPGFNFYKIGPQWSSAERLYW
jgi:type IV pilus assembly protein PilA